MRPSLNYVPFVGFFRHEMHPSQLRSALGKNKSAYKFNELRVKSK